MELYGYLQWICPKCGDVCYDPNDYRLTECHNHHAVMLGHGREDGYQDAYLIDDSE